MFIEMWLGFVDWAYAGWWQAKQSVGVPLKTIGVALSAGSRYMCPCKREFRVIMVKCPGNCAGRMAFVAWDAGIGISSNAIVLAVHISLVMVMTIDTCEGFITARCIMTGGTTAPGTCVFPEYTGKYCASWIWKLAGFQPGRVEWQSLQVVGMLAWVWLGSVVAL